MKKYDCVGLGIIVLDHLITVKNYPVVNSKNVIKSHQRQGGGPVPTALAVLGQFGKDTALVAKLDENIESRFLVHELDSFNIDTDYIVRAAIDTPEAFVIIDENGDRTVLLNRTSAADLRPKEIPVELVAQSKILHLDGQETDAAIMAAKVARENNVLVSIDIGSNRHIPDELLELVDIAIVSERFADAQLVENNPLKSAEKLLTFGSQIAGVTCGRRGSYFATSATSFFQPALPVDVVDSTGAGDVFHGASLFGILQGYTETGTVLFASAAAALACTKIGGKLAIPTIDDIKSLIKNDYNINFINGA